jgi:hypothetical protein
MRKVQHYVGVSLSFVVLLCAGTLAAKDSQPQFKTMEVKHFTVAEGVALPDKIDQKDYLSLLYDQLREQLEKHKLAGQVLPEGAAVSDADAADSVVVEGKISAFKKAGSTMLSPGMLAMEISLYHRKDHSLITTIRPSVKIPPAAYKNDETFAKGSAGLAAGEIKKALK